MRGSCSKEEENAALHSRFRWHWARWYFHSFTLIHSLRHRAEFPEPHHVWLWAGRGAVVVTRGLSSVSLQHLSAGAERQVSPSIAQA